MNSRYVNQDHIGWVQDCITAEQRQPPTAADKRAMADRRGWYAAPAELNAFHKRALCILGIVGGGIYNAPVAWHLTRWSPNQLIFNWTHHHGIGTWDYNQMTELVFLCHSARIRAYFGPKNRMNGELFLSERQATGGYGTRHPSLDEALAEFYSWFPHDHELTFPGDKPPAMPMIREAITEYYHALDTRQHGGVAQNQAFTKIEAALGMSWVQGATLKKESTAADS